MRAVALAGLFLALSCSDTDRQFEPVQPDLFAAGGTLTNAWADFDNDGDPDLFVGFNGAPNRLYRNDGGRFTDVAGEAGVADSRATRAAAWGDFDGDGDADLLIGFTPAGGPVLRLYRNDRGGFHDVTESLALRVDSGSVRQASWIDVEGDGDADLFIAFRDRPNALFLNGDDGFSESAAALGLADARRSVGAVWFDYDADGDLDVYVANMDGDANGFFRNDGDRFTDVAGEVGLQWGGRLPGDPANGTVRPCAADVNGDGRLDLFMANYGRNGLFLNRGDSFEDVSVRWGIAVDSRYDSCAFGDFDNDGLQDLYINGTITGGVSHPDHLFRNLGDRFEESFASGVTEFDADHGVQWADFDADGDLDIALTTSRPDGGHPLLRNMLDSQEARRSVNVRVVDGAGRPCCAGAELHVFEPESARRIATRLIDSGSGYNSQSILPSHFGLPESGAIDLEVVIPLGGRRIVARLDDVALPPSGDPLVVRVDATSAISIVR